MAQYILHIIARDAWESARESAELHAPSLETQGFLHFSTPEQVVRVANSIFPGVRGLAILVVEVAALIAPLRWEPPDMPGEAAPPTGEVFPHLYGPLNVSAVRGVVDFPPMSDGTFVVPALLESYLKE
jgi:uncharacterized protein (DUF952 family)